MSEFSSAIPTIFYHEGLFVDDPSDPGGATKFGMSLRFLKQMGDIDKDGFSDGDINKDGTINVEDVKNLNKENAEKLYYNNFWLKYRYGMIEDQRIATKIFDLAVNMGAHAAHKVAQRAVRAATNLKLEEDGILGIKTIGAINIANPALLLVALKSEAAGYYRSIKYRGSENFINGWLNRAYANVR